MTAPARIPNFDRVARIYRWAEYLAVGPLLQRTRLHFLPQLTDRRRAHVLGDGDGRFLAALLATNSHLHALAVDTSTRMLALLRQRCFRASFTARNRLRTVHASALAVPIAKKTDLIVTHFFLDCLHQDEVDSLASNAARHCRPGTLWLLSDFGLPANKMLRPFARAYVRLLYLAFKLLTGLHVRQLPSIEGALARAGFKRTARAERLGGLLYTELWQLETRIETRIE